MTTHVYYLQLVGYAVGALGATLVFVEYFQMPSYVDYDAEYGGYNLTISPDDVREHTWIGRTGALLLALAFAMEFFAVLLG